MTSPAPVQIKPAPWDTKAEKYWLALNLGASGKFPQGVYAPLEASSPTTSDPEHAGKHRGGLGLIMIVRYSDTPCGPYDELILIPGAFDVAGQNKKRLRVTRIYVSQKDTMYNGRVNWNTPKHLARFAFSSPPVSTSNPKPTEALHIQVYPPSPTAITPFFSATLRPFMFPPALPFKNTWIPSFFSILAQPPLPSALSAPPEAFVEEKEQAEAMLAVGTDLWCEFRVLVSTKRARGCWVDVHVPKAGTEEASAMQEWWPVGREFQPWSVGVWMEDADMMVEEAKEWKG